MSTSHATRRLLHVALLAATLAPTVLPPRAGAAEPPRDAAAWMDEAYRLRAAGDGAGAVLALESARSAGFDPQLVALELGYLAAERGDPAAARARFAEAAGGPSARVADFARRELAEAWLSEAAARRERGDAPGALLALDEAARLAPDPARIELERGYVAAASGARERARTHFAVASAGGGPAAAQARAELAVLEPRATRVDLYADTFAWRRLSGAEATEDAVPTFRMRVLRRPWGGAPLDAYAFVQATRDVASRAGTAAAGPVVLADNAALAGGGLLLGLGPFGAFAQVAAAASLLEPDAPLELDARVGAFLALETGRCARAPGGVRLGLLPCAELYSEVTWLSRFDDDVVGLVRGRAGASWLTTGPVAWQLFAELRAGADRNGDFWDNFADAGGGHRWRLVRPFRLDLLVSANAGRYVGVSGRDPPPARLGYSDLRVELAMEVVR